MKEIVRANIAIEVEQEADGWWHGWIYRKIKGRWIVSGAITPQPTEEDAQRAALALTVGN